MEDRGIKTKMELKVAILIFAVTILSTVLVTEHLIRKFKKKGYVVKDMYKKNKPKIPTMGGLAIMSGLMISLVASQLLLEEIDLGRLLLLYFIVIVYGTFGLLDDLIDIGRKMKVIAPFFMALPIALVVTDTSIAFGFTTLEIGLFALYITSPIYIMVVSNLLNMHEGYNGLGTGVSILLMLFIGAKLILVGDADLLPYLFPILAVAIAFMYYNRYPSVIFLGNSGTLLLGSAVGALLVFFNMELFGVVILLPHIVNFLLWCLWVVLMKLWPEKYPHIKWAKLREDKTIEAPNWLTIKYIVAKLFRVKEWQAILICYFITFVFGVVGLVWF